MKRPYLFLGILAPLAYVLAVIIGGATTPGYSHVYNTISELISAGRHPSIIVMLLFAAYNLGLLAFGAWAALDQSSGYSKKFRAAMAILALIGLIGAAILFFPQDERGTATTFAGTMHIALSGVSSVLTMIAVLLVGIDFLGKKERKLFSYYSFASLVLIVVSGGLAAVNVANNTPYGGLFERLVIGFFILWVFVLSAFLLREKS